MAHGNRMIDWEGLAQQHIAEIQRALPEPIRARATEVPVFFSRASDEKSGTYLGIFEGFSLIDRAAGSTRRNAADHPFYRYPGSSSETSEESVSPRGSGYVPSRIGTLFSGGMKDRLPMSASSEVSSVVQCLFPVAA